ncbi:MAG TPA: formate/nitrite transporter family protein [Acidimicrobiales bacterium]|nr:formate/nitrite transporter family protein [Acidimicrobiales bacterium]
MTDTASPSATDDAEAADTPAQRVAAEDPAGEGPLADAFDRIVLEGAPRLQRRLPDLLATGVVAGVEVSLGVLALLAVENATGSPLLGGLAFSFGFIALLLGHSELFTEGFLVPVAVVAAGEASVWQMLRFWAGTAVANLAGGWLLTLIAMQAYPQLHHTAIEAGTYFIDTGYTARSLCLAIVAGATITLMTRMTNGTDSMPARLIAVVASAFLLAGLKMSHSILESLLIFSSLHAGATSFGYADWAGWFAWTVLGNVMGGIGLVTLLRLVRSRRMLARHREEAAA